MFEKDGTFAPLLSSSNSPRDEQPSDLLSPVQEQEEQIRSLELELAQTKLCLVETQCRNQDLTHQLTSTQGIIQKLRHFFSASEAS